MIPLRDGAGDFLTGNDKTKGWLKNDNRLGILRFQGDYLYDKGENDELFHIVAICNRFTRYILPPNRKKVKKKIKKF